MPTVLRVDGYRFFFYSKEGNESPHIHVIGHGGEMKIWPKTLIIEKSFRLPSKKQKKIVEIVEKNSYLLLSKWKEHHG